MHLLVGAVPAPFERCNQIITCAPGQEMECFNRTVFDHGTNPQCVTFVAGQPEGAKALLPVLIWTDHCGANC